MSDESTKIKHSKRRQKTWNNITKQKNIAQSFGVIHKHKQPHRYAKMHSMNCGNPNCIMCGNPRKMFNERTLKEIMFDETQKWEYDYYE